MCAYMYLFISPSLSLHAKQAFSSVNFFFSLLFSFQNTLVYPNWKCLGNIKGISKLIPVLSLF